MEDLDIVNLIYNRDDLGIAELRNKYNDLLYSNKTWDLILLDDMMPKLSGVETFKKLKEDRKFNTPVVILTANAVSGMKEKYLSYGLDDYLAKPIDKLELDRVLDKYLMLLLF